MMAGTFEEPPRFGGSRRLMGREDVLWDAVRRWPRKLKHGAVETDGRSRPRHSRSALLAALFAFFGMGATPLPACALHAVLDVVATPSAIRGQAFDAAVSIAGLDSVTAIQFALCFDPAALQYRAATAGSYWEDRASSFFSHGEMDMVWIFSRLLDLAGADDTTSGTICVATFVALAQGQAEICICPGSVSVERVEAPVAADSVSTHCDVLSVSEPTQDALDAYNWPNPALDGEETRFSYVVDGPATVRIRIYDRGHQLVAQLDDQTPARGRQSTTLDTSLFASGSYIYLIDVHEALTGEQKRARGNLLIVR